MYGTSARDSPPSAGTSSAGVATSRKRTAPGFQRLVVAVPVATSKANEGLKPVFHFIGSKG
jgi:hypothetical protein